MRRPAGLPHGDAVEESARPASRLGNRPTSRAMPLPRLRIPRLTTRPLQTTRAARVRAATRPTPMMVVGYRVWGMTVVDVTGYGRSPRRPVQEAPSAGIRNGDDDWYPPQVVCPSHVRQRQQRLRDDGALPE